MVAPTIQDFLDSWELFRPAVLSGVLAGGLLGLIGVYVVLRRVVFLAATISQAAGLGVAGSFYAQIHWGLPAMIASPMLGASFTTGILVALVAFTWRGQGQTSRVDSLLGLGFIVGMAGTLALGTRIAQELHDIQTVLFGSAVAVLPENLVLLVWVSFPLFFLHIWLGSGFVSAAFDRDGAAVRGVPVGLLDGLFFASLALAISVSTRVLGVLPTFAFSVLPAMAAIRLAPNVHFALAIATALGASSAAVGYLAAFLYELPVGASQAIVAALFVLVADIAYRLKRRLDLALSQARKAVVQGAKS